MYKNTNFHAKAKPHPNDSDGVSSILNPVRGYRDELRRKGIKPKDYAKENRKQIAKMQKQKQMERQNQHEQELKSMDKFKMSKFKKISSKLYEKSRQEMENPKKKSFLRRGTLEARVKSRILEHKLDHSSCPDPSSSDSSSNLSSRSDSMSNRFSTCANASSSSISSISKRRNRRQSLKEPVPTMVELKKREKAIAKVLEKETEDFIYDNAVKVIKMTPRRQEPVEYEVHHKEFGKVPTYLLHRKEKWAQDEEDRRRNAPDPDCPAGKFKMPEDERLDTLLVLRKSLESAKKELFHMPLTIETPSQIRRKNDLESKLQEIEGALKIFNRPKVFLAKTA